MNFAGAKVVVCLVAAHARAHPGRVLFTALSTTMAAVVVVWVVSGYDSLVDRFDDFAEGYLGRYQLVLVPAGPTTQFGGLGPQRLAAGCRLRLWVGSRAIRTSWRSIRFCKPAPGLRIPSPRASSPIAGEHAVDATVEVGPRMERPGSDRPRLAIASSAERVAVVALRVHRIRRPKRAQLLLRPILRR